jgi:hypothetical protein
MKIHKKVAICTTLPDIKKVDFKLRNPPLRRFLSFDIAVFDTLRGFGRNAQTAFAISFVI